MEKPDREKETFIMLKRMWAFKQTDANDELKKRLLDADSVLAWLDK